MGATNSLGRPSDPEIADSVEAAASTDPPGLSAPVCLQEELVDGTVPVQTETPPSCNSHHEKADPNVDSMTQYKIGKTLGQGAYGKVKLARNEHTGHCVAVKVIDRSKLAVRPAGTKQLAQEINAMKLLRHPNVLRLYEVITTPGKIFMVMEFAEGGDLLSHLNSYQEIVPESRVLELFRGITSGIHFCHMLGVYHRDLKLENILLHEGEVKIGDFGMARITKPSGFCETLCGSPDYAAPEILRESAAYDGQLADVWSCGVILFALLCRRLPFQASRGDVVSLFAAIKAGRFELPNHVSELPAQVVRRMLVVDTAQRATISQIRQHPWVGTADATRRPIRMCASLDFAHWAAHEAGAPPQPAALHPALHSASGGMPASQPIARVPASSSEPCVADVAPSAQPTFFPARTGGCSPSACPWFTPMKMSAV